MKIMPDSHTEENYRCLAFGCCLEFRFLATVIVKLQLRRAFYSLGGGAGNPCGRYDGTKRTATIQTLNSTAQASF